MGRGPAARVCWHASARAGPCPYLSSGSGPGSDLGSDLDPFAVTAKRDDGSFQQPQCLKDASGRQRCLTLHSSQSLCDANVQRRVKKLWGAAATPLGPLE